VFYDNHIQNDIDLVNKPDLDARLCAWLACAEETTAAAAGAVTRQTSGITSGGSVFGNSVVCQIAISSARGKWLAIFARGCWRSCCYWACALCVLLFCRARFRRSVLAASMAAIAVL